MPPRSDSDDDGPPEAFSLKESKQDALDYSKRQQKVIKELSLKAKEKARLRDSRLKAQAQSKKAIIEAKDVALALQALQEEKRAAEPKGPPILQNQEEKKVVPDAFQYHGILLMEQVEKDQINKTNLKSNKLRMHRRQFLQDDAIPRISSSKDRLRRQLCR